MLKSSFTNIEAYILTGDVGGTNTSLGLIHAQGGKFTLVRKDSFQSREIKGLEDALDTILAQYRTLSGKNGIVGACFTIAGPVVANTVALTNLSWFIDGNALSKTLGFPVYLINDISGICYGLPLLDHADTSHLITLKHPDGTLPTPQELKSGTKVHAVVAPGTGLGVGYLVKDRGNFLSLPAEAGHIDWGAFSEETRALQVWMHQKIGINPGVEEFISGRGLENVLAYFVEAKGAKGEAATIHQSPRGNWGAQVAQHYGKDPVCTRIMDLFIEMLARYASCVALWMLPKGGLYLAGGIPAKNRNIIIENDRFMRVFLENYQPGIREQLKQIPVYIALDYGINLPGAAHAFLCLSSAD